MINGISNSFSATIDGLTNFELSSLTVDQLDTTDITVSNNLTVSAGGTLTLPNASILDPYLSANVALKDQINLFTQNNFFSKITMYNESTDKIIYNGEGSEYKTSLQDLEIAGVIENKLALVNTVPADQGSLWFQSGKDFVIVATVSEDVSNFLYRGRSYDPYTETYFDKILFRLTDVIQESGVQYDDTASYINVDYLRFYSSRIGIGQRTDPTRSNIINFYSPTLADFQIGYSAVNGNVVFRASAGLINQDDTTPHDGIITFRVQASGAANQTKMRILPAGVEISNGELYLMSGREIQLNNSDNTLTTNISMTNDGLLMDTNSAMAFYFRIDTVDYVIINESATTISNELSASSTASFNGQVNINNGNEIRYYELGSSNYGLIKAELQSGSVTTLIYDAESHSFKIDGTEIFRIDRNLFTGVITNQFKREVNIRSGNELRFFDSADTAYGTIKTETQSFIITTLIYDAESHSLKIDGTEIFRIDKDPTFGTIINQFKREVNIRSGYKLVLYAPDDTAFSTLQTATDGSLRLVGATVIWRALDSVGNTVSVLTATGDDITVKASNGLRITNSTGTNTSYMNQNGLDFNIYQMNNGFTNFKGVNAAGASLNVIQFSYTSLTMGLDMTCQDINQSGTKLINQTGTGTNQLKSTKITGNLEITGTLTQTGANIAYLANTQTFTGTNTFDEQMTMKKSLNLPNTYIAKTGAQLGFSATPTILSGTITMSTGNTYNVAEITLNLGEWMIYGVASYSCATVATTLTSVEYSISATSGALDGDCLHRQYTPTNVVGQPIVPLSTFVSVSATTTYYLVVRVVFTGGSFVRNSTSAGNCRIKAVRIA